MPGAHRVQVDREPVVPGARPGAREKVRLGTRSVIHSLFNSAQSQLVSQSASEAAIDRHRDAGHHRGVVAEHEQDDIDDLLLL